MENRIEPRQKTTGSVLLLLGGLVIVASALYTSARLTDQVVLTVLVPGFVVGLVLVAAHRAIDLFK